MFLKLVKLIRSSLQKKQVVKEVKDKQAGSSLIELLVGMAIFALLTSMTVTIFFNIIQLQTKNAIATETYSAGQVIMSDLTRSIRSAKAIIPELTSENSLALRNNDNEVLLFYLQEGKVFLASGEDDPAPIALNGDNIQVERLFFRVTEPVSYGPEAVTIQVSVNSQSKTSNKASLQAQISLSTTVSLRAY